MILAERSLDRRVAKLKEYVGTIKRLQKQYTHKQYLIEDIVRRAIERYLHLSLEAVLDISDHIIAQEGFRKPEEYREAIEILGEEGILPKPFASKFADAASFRNILAHDYLDLDQEKVYKHFTTDSRDIETFLKHIVRFLEREK